MKRCFIPTSVLLILGTIFGQDSSSTMRAQQTDPAQQDRKLPGMSTPEAPQAQPQPQQMPSGQEQMPGMQMPQTG